MVKILLDAHQVPFSGYYKKLLVEAGIEVEDFYLPKREAMNLYVKQMANSNAKVVHFLWAHLHWPIPMIPRAMGKKVILHWIGSDVTEALKQPRIPWRWLASKHLSMDVSLSDELKALGIQAPVVRGVVPFLDITLPWPTEHCVLTYLPKGNDELYNTDWTLRLAAELPDVAFLVVGNDGVDMPVLPNVTYLGWVKDMESVWGRCRVALRLTKHDGGGGSAMEALARERYAVWTKEYPYCNLAVSFESAKNQLMWCLRREQPNIMGRDYVKRDFDQGKMVNQLLEVYRG